MAKNRTITQLECDVCKERNYSQVVSKNRALQKAQGTLKIKKYCRRCRKHHLHKETK
jgi:large subunit ribosomal protein L33